jgi:hypothetical protein
VKSVSSGERRHDYGIRRSFQRHPGDVYAFVDLTDWAGQFFWLGRERWSGWHSKGIGTSR